MLREGGGGREGGGERVGRACSPSAQWQHYGSLTAAKRRNVQRAAPARNLSVYIRDSEARWGNRGEVVRHDASRGRTPRCNYNLQFQPLRHHHALVTASVHGLDG